VCQEVISQ